MKIWKPKLAPFRKFKVEALEERKKIASFIYQIGESEDLRKRSKEVPLNKVKSKDLILLSDPKFYDRAKFEEV